MTFTPSYIPEPFIFTSYCIILLRLLRYILLCGLMSCAGILLKVSASVPGDSMDVRIKIKAIHFTGNLITQPRIMLREMTLRAGDSILNRDLENELNFNRRRLLNLQLFSSVQYHIHSLDDNTIEVDFTVTELFYWIPQPILTLADRNFNVWWEEHHHRIDRTNLGLELTLLNFRGRNERIGGTIQLGYNKYFDLYYKVPYIDKKLKHGVGFSVTYSTGREINFATSFNKLTFFHDDEFPYRFYQAEFTYTYRPAYAFTHEFNLSVNHYGITHEMLAHNPDYFGGRSRVNFLEAKWTTRFNNTDIRIYPLNGMDARLIIIKKGLGIDTDLNQFSIKSEVAYFKKISKRFSASLITRARLSFPQQQPYFLNRALGFKNDYIRGYEYYVIDGSHFALLRATLRYRILDWQLKNQHLGILNELPLRIYATCYDDAGYVYNKYPGNSFLNNRWLNGYGTGLDIVISYYAKIRIEYSLNHLGQKGLFLHGNKE